MLAVPMAWRVAIARTATARAAGGVVIEEGAYVYDSDYARDPRAP